MTVIHPFPPVFDRNSQILILGSFPSVRSRETGFYYGHPQNRFWKLLANLYESGFIPESIEERKRFLSEHDIALWDVIRSCEITGSSDASIRNAAPNDIPSLLNETRISRIFCNGRRAFDLYKRHCEKDTGIPAILLPSTSAANASWSLKQLEEEWRMICL